MGSFTTFAASVMIVGSGPTATDRPDFLEFQFFRDGERIFELEAEVERNPLHRCVVEHR